MKACPGDTFDRWTVLREGERDGRHRRVWCRCACGREKLVYVASLGSGKSNGCLHCASTTHGVTRRGDVPREYASWRSMLQRCYEPSTKAYANYGGRGITVCERWRNDVRAFIADMGPRPPDTTLDRIDNNGNYEPGNCRWATQKEQCRNTRVNRIVSAFGEARCIAAWAEKTGISATLISQRLGNGEPAESALTRPSKAARQLPAERVLSASVARGGAR